jgi:tRNA (guanine37-N1)-methyltransferase
VRDKRIWVITLFPDYFKPFLDFGVAGQALRGERKSGEFSHSVELVNPRDFSFDNYKSVDDSPFGGGPGMVMRADVLENTLLNGVVKPSGRELSDFEVIYTSPRGRVWNNDICREFALKSLDTAIDKDIVFICGRYEGIDERFLEHYVTSYYSLGDFVLTGGEVAVMTMLDSAMRFVPGVLGNKLSAELESFADDLIEHPQYTRPREFNGTPVPEVLASGHHANIEKWQLEQKIEMTKKYRPDLYEKWMNNKDKK